MVMLIKLSIKKKKVDKTKEDVRVFTVDLRSILIRPKSYVSLFTNKAKLIVHNFTILDIQSLDGYCFLWHETNAGLTPNTFAIIIFKTKFFETYIIP